MTSFAANTVAASQPQIAAANAASTVSGTQVPSGLDGVFAALLARNSGEAAVSAKAVQQDALQQNSDISSQSVLMRQLSKTLSDATDPGAEISAKAQARKAAKAAKNEISGDALASLPPFDPQIPHAAKSDLNSASPIDLAALTQVQPQLLTTQDGRIRDAAQTLIQPELTTTQAGKVRDAATWLQRIETSLGVIPPQRTAKLEEIQLSGQSGDTPLPGVNQDNNNIQSHASLDEFLAKAGSKTDQSHAVKTQIDAKATAALSELANPAPKQAAPKMPSETAAQRETQNANQIQTNDRNAQANSDPSHRDQRQNQRQDQNPNPSNSVDAANATPRPVNQTAPAQTRTQDTAQTTFQNAVDSSQAALPTGGAQASTVTAALQVAARAHTDAQSPQPDLGAVAISIAAKSQSGSKHFDIRLDPPEFGRIDVRLSVDGAGKAQAMLSADNQQTLDLLQRDKTTLERALKDSGLDLGNNGLNFSLKGQDRQPNDANNNASSRSLKVSAVAASDAANASLAQQHILPVDNTRLDIRV